VETPKLAALLDGRRHGMPQPGTGAQKTPTAQPTKPKPPSDWSYSAICDPLNTVRFPGNPK
jgi:hypothetical protein